MRLIFHGPPGVGKGTQAERIGLEENINHISSGDLLRAAVDAKTEIGLKAREYIENGLLVPDELIVNIVADKINSAECEKGFILDGFPRNISQARVLDSTLEKVGKKLDRVFSFTASEEVIITRISGRRLCKSCGAHYHEMFSPPLKEDLCDKCGSKLFQREDDYPETIKVRLKVYREQTETLIDYYNKKDILVEVDCNGDKKEIQENILAGLQSMSEEKKDVE
ncbi:MAG: adenylate kinase [Candidatus Scalindua sp.]|nr:adenylate kinase [Candidatus Scalindua sp.]